MSNQKIKSTRENVSDITAVKLTRTLLFDAATLTPSDTKLCVVGAHNPGFMAFGNKRVLVVRVDEVLTDDETEAVSHAYGSNSAVPFFDLESRTIQSVAVTRPPDYDPDEDSLIVLSSCREGGTQIPERLYLNYISHLRFYELLPNNNIGHEITRILPHNSEDQYGCEDPRLAIVDGVVTLTFNGLGRCGSTVHRCALSDELMVRARNLLLPPDHKHACLFPTKVAGNYAMLARPLVRLHVPYSGIWLYLSPDGLHWRPERIILVPQESEWDNERVGPGTPPILTRHGWLFFYYGVDSERSYHVGAVLLDRDNPSIVIGRSNKPIFSPSLRWERIGRRADVVFPSGAHINDSEDAITVIYGAADTSIGMATLKLSELLDYLLRCGS